MVQLCRDDAQVRRHAALDVGALSGRRDHDLLAEPRILSCLPIDQIFALQRLVELVGAGAVIT